MSFYINQDPFFYYAKLAKSADGYIPTSSVCNSDCFFCTDKKNPFDIPMKFVTLQTVKELLYQSNWRPSTTIDLCFRLREGETLLHPQIKDIFSLIRDKYPENPIYFRTNGTPLTEPILRLLEESGPIKIDASLHSTNKKIWSEIFDIPDKYYDVAIEGFRQVSKMPNVSIWFSIVPVIGLYGYSDFLSTVDDIYNWFEKSSKVLYPGYNRFMSPKVKLGFDFDFDLIYKAKEAKPYLFLSYCWDIQIDPATISIVTPVLQTEPGPFVVFASEMAYPYVQKELASYAFKGELVPVKNNTYGGNVSTFALLHLSDFQQVIDAHPNIHSFIFPNSWFLNALGEDLSGNSFLDFQKHNAGKSFKFLM